MISNRVLDESIKKLTNVIDNGFEKIILRCNMLGKAYDNLSTKRFDTILEQQEEIKRLTKMLDEVINITFEGNDGFETIVFQRYKQAPTIFHKGKKIECNIEDEVDITMLEGMSVIETTKVHV